MGIFTNIVLLKPSLLNILLEFGDISLLLAVLSSVPRNVIEIGSYVASSAEESTFGNTISPVTYKN